MTLSTQDKKWLIDLAKSAVAIFLKTGKKMTVNENVVPKSVKEMAAVFVTLEVKKGLHGCIGNTEPTTPLYEGVIENAIAAAFYDNRFPEIVEDDLKNLTIEISILSDFEKLTGKTNEEKLNKIRPRIDGVILENNGRKALFLPQVWEELPDKESFLAHLSLKAGLPKNSWQEEKTSFTTFEVVSFQKNNGL